jgi:3-deoxy-manno-octulosonate cytidylyltransferase (CMP-KDO synthetase)
MNYTVLIPARHASTRLPGKMLADIQGKPLIQHTYARALSSGASRVAIATDHPVILQTCLDFGAEVFMTSQLHLTGTDRIAEAARMMQLASDDIIVNLQGDEPGMPSNVIAELAAALEASSADMATACVSIHTPEDVFNPNVVKVVVDQTGRALYFSRAPIPWHRESFGAQPPVLPSNMPYYRHLGIYAFRNAFLQQFVAWPPAAVELTESLEQLRALYYGANIQLIQIAAMPPAGVDTQADLDAIRRCKQM